MRNLNKARSSRGFMFPLFFVIGIFLCFAFGALGADFAHICKVEQELKTATDAGALAGVRDLAVNNPSSTNVTTATNSATTVAGKNQADGVSVASASSGMNVSVTVSSTTNPR